jgi:hypothetical protein
MITIYALFPHIIGGQPTAQPPQIFPSLPAVLKALGGEWECTPVTEGVWQLRRLGFLDLRAHALVVPRDGDPEFDAGVLEMATEVLRQRYGPLIAGDVIGILDNRAAAIREELA